MAFDASMLESSLNAGQTNTLILTDRNGAAATAVFSHSGTTLATVSLSADRTDIPCPASWFDTANVVTSKRLDVSVSVTSAGRTASASFTLWASGSMAPEPVSSTAAPVQPAGVTGFDSLYIADRSRIRLTVSLRRRTLAQIPSITAVTDGSMTSVVLTRTRTGDVEVWEGTSDGFLDGRDTRLDFTVTDERGLGYLVTVGLSVTAYNRPFFYLDALYRCDQNGDPADGGAYFKVKATAHWAQNISGNTAAFTAGVEGGTAHAITSGTASILPGLSNPAARYPIVLTLTDSLGGQARRVVTLPGAVWDMALLHGSASSNLGVGMRPVLGGQGVSTVQLPFGGQYRVDGHNIMNYLLSGGVVGTDDAALENDLLRVDPDDLLAACNETHYVFIGVLDFGDWSNYPPGHSEILEGFGALRFVIFTGSGGVAVLLLEDTPVFGRLWMQRGEISAFTGDVTWLPKWRLLTPTIEN